MIELENPNEWKYISEGNKNAVFSYVSFQRTAVYSLCPQAMMNQQEKVDINKIDKWYKGFVLRIRKEDLALAGCFFPEGVGHQHPTNFCDTGDRVVNDEKNRDLKANIDFQTKVVQPALGMQYIDASIEVQYTLFFLAELRYRTLQEKRIPGSRLKNWTGRKCAERYITKNTTFHGTMIRNYTVLYSSLPVRPVIDKYRIYNMNLFDLSSFIGVEIKPKAGYISSSPLVKPARRNVKYRCTRFETSQRLMQLGYVKREWDTKKKNKFDSSQQPRFKKSAYSPLDFFSIHNNTEHQEQSIRRALDALFECPQVNLRIWWNPQHNTNQPTLIFGNNTDVTEEASIKLVEDFMKFSKQNDNKEAINRNENGQGDHPTSSYRAILFRNIKQVVTQILLQEKTLRRNLLQLQRNNDLIDSDGAVEVYKRLVEICGNSHTEAQSLIDSNNFLFKTAQTNFKLARNNGFLDTPPDCPVLSKLLTIIKEFKTKLSVQRWNEKKTHSTCNYENNNWMNQAYTDSLNCVHHLNKDGCVWLLQHWLFSLTMCDVSVFATFHPIPEDKDEHPSSTLTKSCVQTKSFPGCVDVEIMGDYEGETIDTFENKKRLAPIRNHEKIRFSYLTKIVDCDIKPSAKLETRETYEPNTSCYKDLENHYKDIICS